ncbi:MAG: SAF domain-containing protein [Acidimicrobiaceae bacterium]|nr:SAF domain-containing protein [Acidimicrobiaceae bacterium]MCY3644318.1 SAF domain-containing protein [Acidimicrobiaceae bacterium]
MTDADINSEPDAPGRRRSRRRRKADSPEAASPEPGRPAEFDGEEAPSPRAARARRTRRQMPESTKRILLIVAGVLVLVACILGFYLTSDAFDERSPVLVAARDIADGETVSAADFTSALVLLDPAIPYEPWTAAAPVFFEGMVAVQPIPAGSLVRFDMVREPESGAEGSELEMIVPLDLTLATQGVFDGDEVLLVDPGEQPGEGGEGRPRQVVRAFRLTNFDGSRMRLFLPPEQWAEWDALLEEVGGALMVLPLGDGDDAEDAAGAWDAVWRAQWAEEAEAVALAVAEAAAEAEPVAGPGELEVIVSFDTSLVPTSIGEGALVLLVDPGAEPLGNDPGRAREVIGSLVLENYADGQMRMFLPPEEWQYWRSLPEELGAPPMVLPVPPGSDIDDMSARLNAQWHEAWQRSVRDSGSRS